MHTNKQYTIKDTNSDLNSQYLCQNCHNDNIYIYTHTLLENSICNSNLFEWIGFQIFN